MLQNFDRSYYRFCTTGIANCSTLSVHGQRKWPNSVQQIFCQALEMVSSTRFALVFLGFHQLTKTWQEIAMTVEKWGFPYFARRSAHLEWHLPEVQWPTTINSNVIAQRLKSGITQIQKTNLYHIESGARMSPKKRTLTMNCLSQEAMSAGSFISTFRRRSSNVCCGRPVRRCIGDRRQRTIWDCRPSVYVYHYMRPATVLIHKPIVQRSADVGSGRVVWWVPSSPLTNKILR